MDFYKQNLKHLREAKGITQEELAKAVGVKKQAVTHWEKGSNLPRPSRIRQIANVLECSIGELSDLEERYSDTFSVADEKLSFVFDNWTKMSGEQQTEVVGMVRVFVKMNKGQDV